MKFRKLMLVLLVLLLIAGGIYLWFKINPSFGGRVEGERLERMQESPNFKDGKFQNPVETLMQTDDMPLLKIMREFFFAKGDRVPESPIQVNKYKQISVSDSNQSARVTWLGHSTVLIEMEGKVILCDPVFGKRVSPVSFMGTKAFPYTHNYKLEDLPEIDLVIISHDHYDHLDYHVIRNWKDEKTKFVMPLGVGTHLERWGIGADRITELDWWESFDFGKLKLSATPARHFSGRRSNNRFTTLWASWVIEGAGERIFFGADSGYFPGFKEIGDKFGKFDLVMLECGQYSQYWPYIHMAPEETFKAAADLNAEVLLPIHWAKYKLSIHSWIEPVERLLKASDGSVKVTTPEIGQSFYLTDDITEEKWWLK